MTRDYSLQYCNYLFPPSEGGVAIQRGKTAADLVRVTGGWDRINTTRVMYTNGQLDPWRDATMSSVVRPGGPLKSTPELPVRVVENGTHCSELIVDNWAVNPALKQLATEAVQNMKQWVDEFRPQQS